MVTVLRCQRLSGTRQFPARPMERSHFLPAVSRTRRAPATSCAPCHHTHSMTSPDSYQPILESGRWFAQLPPAFAQALVAMAHIRHLQTGEVLFLRGNAPCGLYAVVRGAISISGTGGKADEVRAALLIRLEPPHWFGEISVDRKSVV